MKTILTIMCVLSLPLWCAAEEPTTRPDVIGHLSSSAQQELDNSSRDLARLREEIEKEKVPLAEELTRLEERLAQLRKDQANTARLADTGNLDIANLKTEMKARQDELAYVSNIMDEYARTYESKVHVSEMQYLGEAAEAAKQAPTNTALSQAEAFARQTDFVNLSLKRLFKAIGGMRFDGVGVDLQSNVVEGQFAIIGPVALFRSKSGAAAGLAVPQTGSTKPLIRPLEGAMQAGLATLVATGEGQMPLDPSRGAALKALVQKTNLIHIFMKGGPIMWPLLLASIMALGTVLERMIFLLMERMRRSPKTLAAFFDAVSEGKIQEAIRLGEKSKFYVVRSLTYALGHTEESLANALMYAQARERKRYRRGIMVLGTVITLAPLLGLLGTITGMMGSFSVIGGDLSSATAVTGGVAEALIATAFGLGIAISSLIPFNALNSRAKEASHEMEAAGTQLELLIPPSKRKALSAAPLFDTRPDDEVGKQVSPATPGKTGKVAKGVSKVSEATELVKE
jgi:biopolymer transport protein ExbB